MKSYPLFLITVILISCGNENSITPDEIETIPLGTGFFPFNEIPTWVYSESLFVAGSLSGVKTDTVKVVSNYVQSNVHWFVLRSSLLKYEYTYGLRNDTLFTWSSSREVVRKRSPISEFFPIKSDSTSGIIIEGDMASYYNQYRKLKYQTNLGLLEEVQVQVIEPSRITRYYVHGFGKVFEMMNSGFGVTKRYLINFNTGKQPNN